MQLGTYLAYINMGCTCLNEQRQETQMKSILDPSFRYTKSVDTDLRKTFARIRREQRKVEQSQAAAEAEAKNKVLPIKQRQREAAV